MPWAQPCFFACRALPAGRRHPSLLPNDDGGEPEIDIAFALSGHVAIGGGGGAIASFTALAFCGAVLRSGMQRPSRKSPARAGPRRATSHDVARAAGVSQSAVSRCFTPGRSIAPKTRDRILSVAAELGYKPNALAQGLISGRTNIAAVLISPQHDLYYLEVLAELTDRLHACGMRVLLFSLGEESDVDALLDEVWRHGVDGVISAARLSDEQVRLFADQGTPLVLYNRTSDRIPVASVSCDSALGERLLVDKLLATGHRRFGIIAGPADSFISEERYRAALDRLGDAGVRDVPVRHGDFSYESGALALRGLLEEDASIEAVISVNDLMAIGAIDVARDELGLSIPRDLSVVGFDGADPASWRSYRVTSIRQPVHRMTEAAVSMLLERVRDGSVPAERRQFAGEFIPGTSARLGAR